MNLFQLSARWVRRRPAAPEDEPVCLAIDRGRMGLVPGCPRCGRRLPRNGEAVQIFHCRCRRTGV